MPFNSAPSKNGLYHIKVLNQNLFLESIPAAETESYSPWIRLASPTGHKKQQWILTRSSNASDEWKIACAVDNGGVTIVKSSQTYRGYGFPNPGGDSLNWKIADYGKYSKISSPGNGADVFDSEYRSEGHDAVHLWKPLEQSKAPFQCYVFEFIGDTPTDEDIKLDVVFLQDATGSQQPYIDAVRDEIMAISNRLREASGSTRDGSDSLRLRLILFRDHPPQDRVLLDDECPFTSDVNLIRAQLNNVVANGGGDLPEAQCDALEAALRSPWRDNAAKIVILITDSPPHGVERENIYDGFPDGCPLQKDPVRIVDAFVRAGITLHMISCEPTLTNDFIYALDFYKGLVAKTHGGLIIPLGAHTDTENLQAAITGLVIQALDSARLAAQYSSDVRERADAGQPIQRIVSDLHGQLKDLGVRHHEVKSANTVYLPNDQGDRNARVWEKATQLKEAKGLVVKPEGHRIIPNTSDPDAFQVKIEKADVTLKHFNVFVQKILKAADNSKA